jgi:hypothetical protein
MHMIKTGSNAGKATFEELYFKIGDKTLTSMTIITEVSAVSTMTPLYTH